MAAGLASLGAAALDAQSDKPVQIGIIGLGNRSKAHFAGLKGLTEGKIVALCDLESARMDTVNKALPEKAETYTDYRELIKDKNVGAVVIVTPGYLHHEMAVAALRAGKDVLMEKPLATNYADALDLIREAKRSGRIVAVGMQKLYSRSDVEMRRVVESGRIGPVRLINYQEYRGDWFQGTWKYTDPATGKKTSWRLLNKTAGSSELEFSIHAFATIASLVKSPLARLTASGGVVHYQDRETRDISSIIADFETGARLNYSFSCFAPSGGTTCMVLCDKGALRRDGGHVQIAEGTGKFAPLQGGSDEPGERAEPLMYREFFQDVRERKPSPIRPEVALEPSKIAYAAQMSIAENRTVTAKDFS